VGIKKLSILVPVYNEEATIAILVDRLIPLNLPSGIQKEIIVIDDGSTDGTYNTLSSLRDKIVVLVHKNNRGKGMAIRTGLDKATGDYAIVQDADLEYDPSDIARMVAKANETGEDAIFGSRRLPSPGRERGRWYYYLGGVYLTILANLLYGTKITDEPTCYKMVKTSLLKSFQLTCTGFEFCPEVVAKLGRRHIKIVEIPISYHPRSTKEGKKIKLKDAFIATWVLVKYRFSKNI
jgi:glycosyltransferase involved in cell wall biosynthesis